MKNKEENIYQREASLANKKKIISAVTIVAIFVIVLAICIVAIVIDSKENEAKKQALVQNEQKENGKNENTINQNSNANNENKSSQNEQGNNSSNQIANNQIKPKALVDDEKQTVYTDSEGNQAPIPKGYVASKAEGETEIKTGLVIYEGTDEVNDSNVSTAQTTRNQYVWVPVPDAREMYGIDSKGKKWGKLYEFGKRNSSTGSYDAYDVPKALDWTEVNGIMSTPSQWSYREPNRLEDYDKDSKLKTYGIGIKTAYEFQIQLEKEFNGMIASVEKYGGFYIGRYETGNWHERVPAVIKGNSDISEVDWSDKEVTWYAYYSKSKKLAGANVSVRTSMIWGCQWDRTLKWLVESGSKEYSDLIDSRSWGNYNNSTGDAATNSRSKRPTGYYEYWKANNIYDMAGNVWDWTIEAINTNGRAIRRGLLRRFRF